MEAKGSNAAKELLAKAAQSKDVGFHELLHKLIASGSLDFDTWTSLISEIEKSYPDDMKTISLVYDSFLSKFPLCYVYWTNFAYHMARLSSGDKAVEIFERAVESATLSVGLWVDYCSFGMTAYKDLSYVRRLFKRGVSFVGKDYLSHTLWDKYMKFEFSQQQWSSLAYICIQALRFPTKKLHSYYDNLKKLVYILEEEMASQHNCSIEVQSEAAPSTAVTTTEDEIYHVIRDLDGSDLSLRSKALHKYKSIGEHFYKKACELDEKICCFETCIRRSFFHVKPLDDDQLKTWHNYLDFIEKQGDLDWALKLYERCLIPCANYPEFWMRYVEFVETKGGRELANFALDRATQIFLKNVPEIHLFNARFKEKIGDADGARAAFLQCDTQSNSYFTENVIREANMEKRLGNLAAASSIYEKALEMAAERQKLHTVPILYVHFSRLKYVITGNADAAIGIIIDGIQHLPHCRLLLVELIKFAMTHEGSRQVNVLDPIIAKAIFPGLDVSQGLCTKDREDLSLLYLEFVDLCGTNHDVRKSWNRHMKLFPHLMNASLYKYPTSGNQLLSMTTEGRHSNQPSVDSSSDHRIQLTVQEQELLLPENHASLPVLVFEDQTPPEDDDYNAQAIMQQSSIKVAVQSTEDASGVDESIHDLVHRSEDDASRPIKSTGDDASGPMESTHDLEHQIRNDASAPMELIHDLEHQSGKDAIGQSESTNEFEQPSRTTASLKASQEYPNTTIIDQGQDHEFEQHLKPISLESLSLSSLENECQDLMPIASDEHDVLQEISVSIGSVLVDCENINGDPSISSSNRTPAADSAKIQNESDKNASVSPSSSADQSPRPTHLQSEVPLDTGESKHQVNHMVTASESATAGFHGHSQDQQQQAYQQQQQHPTAEMDAQVLMSQGYPHHPSGWQAPQTENGIQTQNQHQSGAAQGNLTSSPALQVHNVPQQSSVSASESQMSSQPVPYPQAQISHYPTQGSQQPDHTQHNHVYNQMLQYHYQQQQQQQQQQLLQQQYQQQLLQMQQPYLQQQQLQQQQPYHQQQYQLQQQHWQQEQHYFQQQQLQQPPYQPQQQQYLLYQSQEQQQVQQQQQYQQLAQQLQQGQEQQLQQGQEQQLEVQENDRQLQQYYQFGEVAYQQRQQGYQQQVEQGGYHLLLQQYKLQQEQGYQQLLHQYQLQQQQGYQELQQPQPESQQNEQLQQQQQTTSTETLTWHGCHYQQGEGTTPVHGTAVSRPSDYSHPQQQSPQIRIPHAAGASGPVASPHCRQQSPYGVSSSHSEGATGPAVSPHLEQQSPQNQRRDVC